MSWILRNESSEYKRVKGLNKNIVDKTNHNEYKDVLTNKRCLRYLIQRTQNKNHWIETYEMNKISLFCFNGRIYVVGNVASISIWCLEKMIIDWWIYVKMYFKFWSNHDSFFVKL